METASNGLVELRAPPPKVTGEALILSILECGCIWRYYL